jgi:hypothetical protein
VHQAVITFVARRAKEATSKDMVKELRLARAVIIRLGFEVFRFSHSNLSERFSLYFHFRSLVYSFLHSPFTYTVALHL